jgi:hypothetical protein
VLLIDHCGSVERASLLPLVQLERYRRPLRPRVGLRAMGLECDGLH